MHPGRAALLQFSTIDFEKIRLTEQRIFEARKAPNTQVAYASAWRAFLSWCQATHLSSLPATPQTLRDFASWCINDNYRLQTVKVRMSAIAHYHKEAGCDVPYDKTVQRHIANAKRLLKEKPKGKAALTYEMLRKIAPRFADTPLGHRNRAMVLLGFASGWRRSEIGALYLADVNFVPQGMELWQRSSKTDQTGEGRLVGIEPGTREITCPVRALASWIEVRGNWAGPLFPKITPMGDIARDTIARRNNVLHAAIKEALEAIGEDARNFGAHSLRSGMITEASKHGASEAAIMQRTGHRSSAMLRHYIRPATAFDFNPLKGVL